MIETTGPRHRSHLRHRGMSAATAGVWAAAYTILATVVAVAAGVAAADPVRWIQP